MTGLRRLWAYALVAFLYLATSPQHAGLNNPNEVTRVYMAVAAVEHGDFALDPIIARWGGVDDKARRDGRLYSSKAPLQSLVGVPAYAAGRPLLEVLGWPADKRHTTWLLRLLGTVPFAIALSLVLLAHCRRRAVALGAPLCSGTALGLALALGTMHYPYALTFTGHALAAATAGGCLLALVGLERTEPRSRRWWALSLSAGALGGACPFAEYPAALVALPALVAALIGAPRGSRAPLLSGLAVGGAPTFAVGLWSHAALWGSPFKTGYSFLENTAYAEVHDEGFFGVATPSLDALFGTLFSPGTGLFFFSPVLALGLIPLVAAAIRPRDHGLGRPIAVAALIGFSLALLFMAGHRGWRGGWTLGPRYIIPVVTVLGVGLAEGLSSPRLRPWILGLGAASIVLTGPAAALYPHLSDVYTNPLAAFVLPSYLRGQASYGLAHAAGLTGTSANLVHLLPLLGAAAFVALSSLERVRAPSILALVASAALVAGLLFIPERSPVDARRENRRLWGFWEPEGPKMAITAASPRPGRLLSARHRWSQIRVERRPPGGPPRPCVPAGRRCTYGDDPWQRFGPEVLPMDGEDKSVLFLHPVGQEVVAATVPVPSGARTATLRYGLADASVAAKNPHPVRLTVRQSGEILAVAEAGRDYGLASLDLALTSTTNPLELTAEVERDGARVFGFDVEFYDRP